MHKKILLIYSGEGADPVSLHSLIFSLQRNQTLKDYKITLTDHTTLLSQLSKKEVKLLIFPGGRDLPYHKRLQGKKNAKIREFVEQGGQFLGICAGAYYGCAEIAFDEGGKHEICQLRELGFFPGKATGPVFNAASFSYTSYAGAQLVNIQTPSGLFTSYYHGGCHFQKAGLGQNAYSLWSYSDHKEQPAALIKCRVQKGSAVLCGVHPEYSALDTHLTLHLPISLVQKLKDIEKLRSHLFDALIAELDL